MKRSKSTPQNQNQNLTLRRSERLADKFKNLTHDLTTKIFSNLEDDPKTLIRCSAVSKNWASFVSKTVNLSQRFSSRGGKGHFLACSKRHYHIPLSSLPSIMKVFANLEYLEIKICHPISQPPVYQNVTKMTVTWVGSNAQTDTCVAFEVGSLSNIGGAMLSYDFEEVKNVTIRSSLVMDFYLNNESLHRRPKKLRKMVIMSAKIMHGLGSGKVFITEEQLEALHESVSNSRVNESWLEDTENVVYWHKNHLDKEYLLYEQAWLFYRSKYLGTKDGLIHEVIVREENVKELLDGLDEEDIDDAW